MSRKRPVFRPRRRWGALAASAAVAIGFGALAGVVALVRSSDGPPTSEPARGVTHVHGLGVNPRDGRLHVATHGGVFVIDASGRAEPVSPAVQDTMGLTVVGADRFLASGHPDLQDRSLRAPGRPPLLGLVESRDAGRTWRSRSLLGEADFHVLANERGVTFGWNATSGEFMVSRDGSTWERRSKIDLIAFAVDRSDVDDVVASDGSRLFRSRDGGRSWEGVPDAPGLSAMSPGSSGFLGAGGDGTVYRSEDGTSWVPLTRLEGAPRALTVAPSGAFIAVEVAGAVTIQRSRDGGRTWQVFYAPGG